MTAYEAIMIMLGTLTLMMSIISIVIKLLLYITKIIQKKATLHGFGEHWGSYFSQENPRLVVYDYSFFHLYYNLW